MRFDHHDALLILHIKRLQWIEQISQKYVLIVASAIALSACSLLKKTESTTTNDLPTINLDTVETTAETPEPQQYQSSATRISDILHTKLDVSFDWKKQYMYGKATITVKPYFYATSTLTLDARGMEIKEISLVLKNNEAKGASG